MESYYKRHELNRGNLEGEKTRPEEIYFEVRWEICNNKGKDEGEDDGIL